MIEKDPVLEFRPALPADIPQILEVSKGIWGGGDYLPSVIDEWIAKGGTYVGIIGGEIIGVSRILRVGDEEWWLEGLRIKVALQGHGYGQLLHEATMRELKRIAKGVVRFSSADTNRSVPMALKDGFHFILRLPYLYFELEKDKEIPDIACLRKQYGVRLAKPEEPGLLERLYGSCLEQYNGLLFDEWEFFKVTKEKLRQHLEHCLIFTVGEPPQPSASVVLKLSNRYRDEADFIIMEGDGTLLGERLAPSLLPWVQRYDQNRIAIGGGAPTRYYDSLIEAGAKKPRDFTDMVVLEQAIADI